jgi:hypothetical protein
MHASKPLILRKSRIRKRARTDLCGGRSVMVVPTATVIPVQKSGWGKRGFIEACLWAPGSAAVLARWARWKPPVRNSESAGTAIYIGCTRQAQLEPISTAVFERMMAATGGKAYFAKTWKAEQQTFASIRDDLAHLYSLSYYPRPNPNRGIGTRHPLKTIKRVQEIAGGGNSLICSRPVRRYGSSPRQSRKNANKMLFSGVIISPASWAFRLAFPKNEAGHIPRVNAPRSERRVVCLLARTPAVTSRPQPPILICIGKGRDIHPSAIDKVQR